MIKPGSFAALLAALLFVLLVAPSALAHAELVGSTPEDGATVDTIPETVTLLFSEELTNQSSFVVVAPDGSTVGGGAVDLNDLERKTMRAALPAGLASGVYTISWVAYSAEDDHGKEGSISFTLALAAPTVAPTVVPADRPTTAPTAAPTALRTATPRPTVLVINSPTSPEGPTQVNDDGAAAGRMIALLVSMVMVVGITAALVLTRRRGGQQ